MNRLSKSSDPSELDQIKDGWRLKVRGSRQRKKAKVKGKRIKDKGARLEVGGALQL